MTLTLYGRALRCEAALTTEAHRVGLSKHAALADDEGMLFVFDGVDRPRTFHMAEVAFPIDIAWYASNGGLVRLVEGIEPGDQRRWTASAAYVLETPGGWFRRAVESWAPDPENGSGHAAPDPGVGVGFDSHVIPFEDAPIVQTKELAPAVRPGPANDLERNTQTRFLDRDLPDAQAEAPFSSVRGPAFKRELGRDPTMSTDDAEGLYPTRMTASPTERRDAAVRDKAQFGVTLAEALEKAVDWYGGSILTWSPDTLNGERTASAHVSAEMVKSWLRMVPAEDPGRLEKEALSQEGLETLGDIFVLAGVADFARMGKDRRSVVLYRGIDDAETYA